MLLVLIISSFTTLSVHLKILSVYIQLLMYMILYTVDTFKTLKEINKA